MVLVVDENDDSREILRILFEMCEAQAVLVATVDEAIEVMEHVIPDLLISELNLPKRDGDRLMGRIAYLRSFHDRPIPAIALTIYAGKKDREHALLSGFHKHISKPFEFEYLVREIINLVEEKILTSKPDIVYQNKMNYAIE